MKMSIIQKRMVPVLIDFQCDECKVGFYRPTGTVKTSYPPQYPHICNHCKHERRFVDIQFPYTEFVEEGTPLPIPVDTKWH